MTALGQVIARAAGAAGQDGGGDLELDESHLDLLQGSVLMLVDDGDLEVEDNGALWMAGGSQITATGESPLSRPAAARVACHPTKRVVNPCTEMATAGPHSACQQQQQYLNSKAHAAAHKGSSTRMTLPCTCSLQKLKLHQANESINKMLLFSGESNIQTQLAHILMEEASSITVTKMSQWNMTQVNLLQQCVVQLLS